MMPATAPQSESTRPNFPQIEEEIAAFWERHRIFERSIEERSEQKMYIFYDGPPFATGTPHYGHLLQSTIKDAVPRYFTMQGRRVPRRWGWDCHGLPIESMIEKALNLDSKRDIEAYGIEKFNLACFNTVLSYAAEWKKYIRRLGRWVDMEHAYKTMDASFIESVWWAFAELYAKKFVYKDLRVSLYCPRCSTPLSNSEIAMGNSYIDTEDPSIIVKFKLVGEENTYALAWTTTPWTLPANVALAVHPDAMYVRVKIRDTGETLVFADALLSKVLRQYFPLGDGEVQFEILSKSKGSELVGKEYEPLYPLSVDARERVTARSGETMYRMIDMDYVSIEDGTGIVHVAPAFGEEDFLAAKLHDIPVVVTVDEEGRQRLETGFVAGMKLKDSDSKIIAELLARGLLYSNEQRMHSVPVCWRCNTQLLYKAQPAWFVNVMKLKSKVLDTAKKIQWHPEHFKAGRFGKGLETAPDWNISRTRFWGTPIPVWECSSCERVYIFGSIAELERRAGRAVGASADGFKLHRPYIDEVTVPCECGGAAKRIPEVFDTWFDSGSMPYATLHYPFENKKFFEQNFPADFIAEAQDQTRGWFYNMHVLSTALFGTAAFRDVICTGLIMAEDGKKMSKSLKNYPDPWDLMNKIGADALRIYLLSSPVVQAEQLNFSERDCETIQRALFGTLWNVRAFYILYAGRDKIELTKPRSTHVLDRWLMARLTEVTQEMTEAMDGYDLLRAVRPLRGWVDDLSTWWLRRSRERLKSENAYERLDAMRTLREALLQTSLLFAPLAPFFAEKLYQDMEGAKMSVHLDRWPKADGRLRDVTLLADMTWIREIAAAAHEARARVKLPIRQALASLTVKLRDAAFVSRVSQRKELLSLVREETNVERVTVQGGDTEGAEFCIELDTVITPELKRKGAARELARHLMQLRKHIGVTPQDAVAISFAATDQGVRDMLESLARVLPKDVRTVSVRVGESLPEHLDDRCTVQLNGAQIEIGITKA